ATSGARAGSLTGHARLVTDLDFLDADVLVSTGRDGTVRAWSLSDRSELALLRQRGSGGEGVRSVDEGQRSPCCSKTGTPSCSTSCGSTRASRAIATPSARRGRPRAESRPGQATRA